jgi:hypothetical protein
MRDVHFFCDGLSFAISLSFEGGKLDLHSLKELGQELLDLKTADSWIHLEANGGCRLTVFGNLGFPHRNMEDSVLMITGIFTLKKKKG